MKTLSVAETIAQPEVQAAFGAIQSEAQHVRALFSTIGRLAKGVPKRISPEESERRRASLAAARAKRWPKRKAGGRSRPAA